MTWLTKDIFPTIWWKKVVLLDFYCVHIWYLIPLILSNVLPIPVVELKCQMLYYSIFLDTNILLILRFHIVNLILRMTSRLVLIPISNWISSNSIQKVNLSYVSQCAAKTLFRYDVQVFSLLSYLQLSEYIAFYVRIFVLQTEMTFLVATYKVIYVHVANV